LFFGDYLFEKNKENIIKDIIKGKFGLNIIFLKGKKEKK
jgi:hypothetical protein